MGSGISFGPTFNDFWRSTNQKDETLTSLLVCKVPGEGFPALRDADMQEVLNSYTAELPWKDREHLAVFSEPEDEGYGNAVERTSMKISATCQVS
jgi:hypothetical protein